MFSSVIEVCSHWSMLLTCMIWLAREKVAANLPALKSFSITAIGGRPHGATRRPNATRRRAWFGRADLVRRAQACGAGRVDLPP